MLPLAHAVLDPVSAGIRIGGEDLSIWTLMLWGWAGAAVLQLVAWLIHLRTTDAGWVDAAWAASLGLMAVGYGLAGDASPTRVALVATLGGVWGGRLTWHLLADRVLRGEEDGRYQHLRAHWGASAPWQFLWFFQAQALLAAGLSLPFALTATADGPVTWLQWLAVPVFAVAWIGEWLADQQLAAFRKAPENRGRVCRIGLWRYSRHPNYFCEWCMWVAFALLAAPSGWAWIAPASMYLLVRFVSGVPYTEKQALRSRGEAYREYQRTTNAFFPGPTRPTSPVADSPPTS